MSCRNTVSYMCHSSGVSAAYNTIHSINIKLTHANIIIKTILARVF